MAHQGVPLEQLRQRSDAWKDARRNRVGGTLTGDVLGFGYGTRVDAARKMTAGPNAPAFHGNAKTRYGSQYEDVINSLVKEHTEYTPAETGIVPFQHIAARVIRNKADVGTPLEAGLVRCDQEKRLYCTPDAYDAANNVVFEYKCYASLKTPKPFRTKPCYWGQVASEILTTGAKLAEFIGGTPLEVVMETVPHPATVVVTPDALRGGIQVSRFGQVKLVDAATLARQNGPLRGGIQLQQTDIDVWAGHQVRDTPDGAPYCVYDPSTGKCPGFEHVYVSILYYFWRACQEDNPDRYTQAGWDAWELGGGVPSRPWHWEHMVPALRLVQVVLAHMAHQTRETYRGPTGVAAHQDWQVPSYIVPADQLGRAGGWPAVLQWQGAWCAGHTRMHAKHPAYGKVLVRHGYLVRPSSDGHTGSMVGSVAARTPKAPQLPWPEDPATTVAHWALDVYAVNAPWGKTHPKHYIEIDVSRFGQRFLLPHTYHANHMLPREGVLLVTGVDRDGHVVVQRVLEDTWRPEPPRSGTGTFAMVLVPGRLVLDVDVGHRWAALRWVGDGGGHDGDGDGSDTDGADGDHDGDGPALKRRRTRWNQGGGGGGSGSGSSSSALC